MSKWSDRFYFFLINDENKLWYYGDNTEKYSGYM